MIFSHLPMFNLPNLFTAANMLSGVMAILLALAGRIDLAPFAVFAGALFDFLDGFAARKLKLAGEMGKQLDSLADMVTFGVAPGLIMMVVMIQGGASSVLSANREFVEGFVEVNLGFGDWMNGVLEGGQNYWLPFVAVLIPFFSLFRLAKFNIDTRQSESFIGLPTPANTLFFMSFPLALSYGSPDGFMISVYQWLFHPLVLAALIAVMSIMLVSELPLFSLKFKSFGWEGNQIRYIFLLISLAFIVLFTVWSLALIVFLYLILSLVETKFVKQKRNEI